MQEPTTELEYQLTNKKTGSPSSGEPQTLTRAVTYNRVSTGRQALRAISLPDQIAQNRAYCEARGFVVVEEVVEAGTATDTEQRPRFQDLIDRALDKPSPFEKIVVHSTSRFYRDDVEGEVLFRKLRRNGVEVISITQDFGEGETADLTRRLMGMIDAQNSRETAKHVKRAMIAAAREGWWMGARAPDGYEIEIVGYAGERKMRKLKIHPERAALVQLIYKLCIEGDGKGNRLGIKKIARYLTERNLLTRSGAPFYTSQVESILKAEYYTGTYWFNRWDSRANVERPRDQWVAIPIPQIITEDVFQRAQVALHENAPKVTAPRINASKVLLTGVARCSICGGAMVIATGTGNNGETHRYYKCAKRLNQGLCDSSKRTTIREAELDQIVIKAVSDHLLIADRVQEIIGRISERREAAHDSATQTLARLKKQYARLTSGATKLLDAIAEGVVTDDALFKAKYQSILDQRQSLQRLIDTEEHLLRDQIRPITEMEADTLVARLRERLWQAPPEVQKRLLRALVEVVIVDPSEIIIRGSDEALAETASASQVPEWVPETPSPSQVHGSEREWLGD